MKQNEKDEFKLIMKNRYFIVSYRTSNDTGHMGIVCAGGYLNDKDTREMISEKLITLGSPKPSNVAIVNIIELTKEDFETWIK